MSEWLYPDNKDKTTRYILAQEYKFLDSGGNKHSIVNFQTWLWDAATLQWKTVTSGSRFFYHPFEMKQGGWEIIEDIGLDGFFNDVTTIYGQKKNYIDTGNW